MEYKFLRQPTLHLVLRICGGIQIFVETKAGSLNKESLHYSIQKKSALYLVLSSRCGMQILRRAKPPSRTRRAPTTTSR